MITLFVTVAGCVIRIILHETDNAYVQGPLLQLLRTYFHGFILDKSPQVYDYSLEFVWDQKLSIIEREKEKMYFIQFYRYKNKKTVITYYQTSMYQTQLVLWDILQQFLAKSQGFLIHASAALINGEAVVFLGKSGAGKSTAMRMLATNYPALADDGAIFKKEGNQYVFYQLPVLEKGHLIHKQPSRYPLGMFCFLHKDRIFKLDQLTNNQIILERLLKQIYITPKIIPLQLENLSAFISARRRFYKLSFAKDEAKMLEFFMMRGTSSKKNKKTI